MIPEHVLVTFYIDGYNLLHADTELQTLANADLESAREILIAQVAEWASTVPGGVAIVFDGQGRVVQRSTPVGCPSNLSVAFGAGNRSADTIIEGGVYRTPDPQQVTVVTSDRSIADIVRGLGGLVMAPEQFWVMLESVQRDVSERTESTQRIDGMTRLEDRLGSSTRKRLEALRHRLGK